MPVSGFAESRAVLDVPRVYTSSVLPNLIVPTLTRYDLLANLLGAIDFPVRHLLIINNGKEYPDYIRKPGAVEQMTWLDMPANLGVAGSWNLGIKSFPHDPVWFICSDDVMFGSGGLGSWFDRSGPDRFVTSDEWPFYQFFSVGENVVDKVGLFDEAIFPANFEDDDFEWRARWAGFEPQRITVPHHHVRQGTVFHGNLASENARTYPQNESYFRDKQNREDLSAGQWSLARRRSLEWRT